MRTVVVERLRPNELALACKVPTVFDKIVCPALIGGSEVEMIGIGLVCMNMCVRGEAYYCQSISIYSSRFYNIEK